MSRPSTPQELETYLQRAGFQEVRVRQVEEWVQAYGVKSGERPAEGGLVFPPPAAREPPVDSRLVEYERELGRLHAVVAEKNAHILRLERLLARIENGRLMRLLRWATRR
jgi:hypothetical protein